MWATRWATPWRRPRLVHTSRKGAGRPEGLVHKLHRTLPDRAMDEARGIPFQVEDVPAQRPAVSSHCFSPRCRDGSVPLRGCSRQNVAIPPARSTTRPYSYPVRLAGVCRPRDHDAQFGRCDVPGGGTHLDERSRSLRRSMPVHGHTPCPGSPEAPSGRPGVRCSMSFSQARDRTAPSGTSPAVA